MRFDYHIPPINPDAPKEWTELPIGDYTLINKKRSGDKYIMTLKSIDNERSWKVVSPIRLAKLMRKESNWSIIRNRGRTELKIDDLPIYQNHFSLL